MVGILTKRIKDKKKRDYVVIAFDIAVIIIFIWWAFNQRAEYTAGANDCAKAWCEWLPNATHRFCPANYSMFGTGYNMSEWIRDYTSTGTELP